MKKKILYNFILYLCGGILVMLGVFSSQILLADIPTFSLKDNQEINININEYTIGGFSRIRYYDNAIYLVDSDKRTVIREQNSKSEIIYQTIGATADETTQPFDIVSYDNHYLISTTTLFINYIDGEHSTTLNKYKDPNSTDDQIALSPQKLASSADGTTYVILGNGASDKLLKFNKDTKQLELFATLSFDGSPLNFDSKGGFCVSEDNSMIYFSIGNKIYQLDTLSREISLSNYNADFGDITYLNTDNLGNFFVGIGNKLCRYNPSSTDIPYVEMPENTVSFDLDLVNGIVYYCTTDNKVYSTQILSENNESLITNYSKISPKVKLTNISASTEVFRAVTTTKQTKLYQFQSLLSPAQIYNETKKLIVLDNSNQTFYYVFDNNSQNENGYDLGYILKADCTDIENEFSEEFADNQALKVITGITKIFCMPISQPIATDTYIPSIGKLSYGDTMRVIPCPILSKDSNGATFVAVQYEKAGVSYVGYIDSRTVVSSELVIPDIESVPNARTKTETIVYNEKNCFNKIDVLAKGCEVKIITTLNGISKIEYYIIEGDTQIVKTGYCKSENLDTGKLTTAQIVGLVLVIISLIVTIIVLILAHRRKKKLHATQIEPTD